MFMVIGLFLFGVVFGLLNAVASVGIPSIFIQIPLYASLFLFGMLFVIAYKADGSTLENLKNL